MECATVDAFRAAMKLNSRPMLLREHTWCLRKFELWWFDKHDVEMDVMWFWT